MAGLCSYCEGPTVYDPDSSATVCTACGREISVDYFTSLPSTNPNEASAFIATDFTNQQRKRYHAENQVTDICCRLGISSRTNEALALVSDLTSDSYGAGDWFSVLAAAAAYVVSRRRRIPISIPQAADAAGCDERQIGRMVLRIVQFLDSGQLPDFDAASALDHAIRTCPSFGEVEEEKKQELIAMGRFLIQCMTKWFLMTGRRPLPAVAAVAAFVAEVSGVEVRIEEIAKEIFTVASTSRVRHRELRETLVKVANALLPWGKDVNLKNLLQNMPVLIQVMETHARRKKKSGDSEGKEFSLEEYLTIYSNAGDEEDSGYFRIGEGGGICHEELSGAEISAERLSNAYKNVFDRIVVIRESGRLDGEQRKKKRTRKELEDNMLWRSWEGSWDFGKKLSLKQVLERDVGYNSLPPSFICNMQSRENRRLKIEAAKRRISRTMDPTATADSLLVVEEDESFVNSKLGGKKKKRKQKAGASGIDWEDCIIELLLLHRVNEDEIEQGQYNRLLDLHVFNSLSSMSTEV